MKQTERLIKTIEDAAFILGLRDDGIVHVYYRSNSVIDVDVQDRVRVAAFKLTNDVKHPCLFEAGDYVSLTKEARANAIKKEDDFPASASAVLVQNLAYKMIVDFYYKVLKPKQAFKVFRNFDEAVEWLKTHL
jgi:hypothetical protein